MLVYCLKLEIYALHLSWELGWQDHSPIWEVWKDNAGKNETTQKPLGQSCQELLSTVILFQGVTVILFKAAKLDTVRKSLWRDSLTRWIETYNQTKRFMCQAHPDHSSQKHQPTCLCHMCLMNIFLCYIFNDIAIKWPLKHCQNTC
jgi:hypothetical protein